MNMAATADKKVADSITPLPVLQIDRRRIWLREMLRCREQSGIFMRSPANPGTFVDALRVYLILQMLQPEAAKP